MIPNLFSIIRQLWRCNLQTPFSKFCILNLISVSFVCSHESNWQQVCIGLGNRWQSTWTNDDPVYWHIFKTYLAEFLNTLRPRQDGRHFADDSFTCVFFNENCCILIKFSLKYIRKGAINNNRALVQIMAWRRSGDKPLSEPMMVRLPTDICVAGPQWVKHR